MVPAPREAGAEYRRGRVIKYSLCSRQLCGSCLLGPQVPAPGALRQQRRCSSCLLQQGGRCEGSWGRDDAAMGMLNPGTRAEALYPNASQ